MNITELKIYPSLTDDLHADYLMAIYKFFIDGTVALSPLFHFEPMGSQYAFFLFVLNLLFKFPKTSPAILGKFIDKLSKLYAVCVGISIVAFALFL